MSRESILRWVRVVLVGLLGGYGVIVLVAFLLQRDLVFPLVRSNPLFEQPGERRVWVDVAEGRVPMEEHPKAGAPEVVFFHGNAEHIGRLRADAQGASLAGLAFWAVEYPGYGDADAGLPSEGALLDAARAALAVLGAPRVCVGHSLGSGVAVAMAAEGRCAALVVISPYTSMVDVAGYHFGWLPTRWLVRDRFDSLARAPQVAVPALVMHGRRDDVIPFVLGERLAAALPGARFLPLEGGHNDVRGVETWQAIGAFVRESGVAPPG